MVIVRDGLPQMVRTLAAGGQHVTDAVAAEGRLSVPEAEAIKRQIGVGFAVSDELQGAAEVVAHVTQSLVEAIRNTLVYYASQHPGGGVELVVLTGGGSYLNGLGQYLSSASRLPVTMGDVLVGPSRWRSPPRLDALAGRRVDLRPSARSRPGGGRMSARGAVRDAPAPGRYSTSTALGAARLPQVNLLPPEVNSRRALGRVKRPPRGVAPASWCSRSRVPRSPT